LWFYSLSLISPSFPPDPTVSVSVSFGPVLSVSLLNPLSPFDHNPFDKPDTRIGFRCRIHRYRSSIDTAIDTDLPFDHDPFDTPYRFSLTNPSIRANNFKFSKSILSFFTVLFTGKVQFGGESPILQAFGTVFASIVQFTTGEVSLILSRYRKYITLEGQTLRDKTGLTSEVPFFCSNFSTMSSSTNYFSNHTVGFIRLIP
jgi:hypothetical protein